MIKKVLSKCSEPLLTGDVLEVEEIELLTQGDNPRTKCWRIVVPYKYMTLMKNPELYPQGWRHRKFFGSRKIQEKNKQPRLEGNVVDEAMRKVEEDRMNMQERQRQELESDSQNVATGQVPGPGGSGIQA